ncbi:helix-turn-helix domain-containing protein [Blautia intestinalis]|uniref:helix-turn-helix domain-containing protein n=1 Tax=Blautia intestinalis TaxID=2763028 RepID=UPI0022E3CEE2|nr:helix-turn-helix transcriptional regulator [Blautia intestinalis]
MTLGDIIRNYRENNNITLGEFANACSLSKGYISMLENNINPRNNKPISPTLPSMAKVASGMGIDLDTLLKMLDKKQPVQLISDKIESSPPLVIDYQKPDQEGCYQRMSEYTARFLDLYNQLSSTNKGKVVSYTKGLLSTQQMEEDVLAAHARTDVTQTQEGVQHDIDIMNDDSLWE